MAETLRALRCGTAERFIDRAAEHEIATEDLHRLTDGRPDDRFTETADGPSKRGLPIVGTVLRTFQHFAGKQKGEGRGIDERGLGLTEFLRPGGAGQLVRDQLVGGMRVGNAKQRLGEAHHRNALIAAEVVCLQKRVEAGRLV